MTTGGPSRSPTRRLAEFAGLLAVGWCVMGATHEAGHVVGAWLGGGRVRAFWPGPWPPPYSTFQPDPHPALTLWAGPALGCAIPICLASLIRRRRAWFLADFCLLANGSYLAVSWVTGDRLLDGPRLLAAGVSPVWLGLFCVATCGVGYVRFRADCRAVWESDGLTGSDARPA